MKICITLFIFSFALTATAQKVASKLESIAEIEKRKDYGLLQRLEVNIVSLAPTLKDYKRLSQKLKKLPKGYLKYIDSIDFTRSNTERFYIQIYSQSRVSKSKNRYYLSRKKKNDSLVLKNVRFDMKMKDTIQDYEAFENRMSEDIMIYKNANQKFGAQRVIFSKIK